MAHPVGRKKRSLSARRAWIEIGGAGQLIKSSMSLSARRAWIEINTPTKAYNIIKVALRKESVDRNCRITAEK